MPNSARTPKKTILLVVSLPLLALGAPAPTQAEEARFVGETRCGTPVCHGAGLPAGEKERKNWEPWKSARTQWLNRAIDRHSRAYDTLRTEEGRQIAEYMAIDATRSQKCLVCHAPDAATVPGGAHERRHGVSCEHCHGPAEHWLEPHVEADWESKRSQYFDRGFYDNDDFELRARKCASCHVAIDHEIVAGGHPPLQFELVAYASVMKHWDDQAEQPPGAFSVDPTIWAIGQMTGLRETMRMIRRRSGGESHQGIGRFSDFKAQSCYRCHHKLIDDAVRQATGHYRMVDAVLAVTSPERGKKLDGLWADVVSGVRSDPDRAGAAAAALDRWLEPTVTSFQEDLLGQEATRKILRRLTGTGERLKRVDRFDFRLPSDSNVVRIDGIELPWWWTTGSPEQTVLAIQALCEPAFGKSRCWGEQGIEKDLRTMLGGLERFRYQPDKFVQGLRAIDQKLR